MTSEIREIIASIHSAKDKLRNNDNFMANYVQFHSNLTPIIDDLKRKVSMGTTKVDENIINEIQKSISPIVESVTETTKKHKDAYNIINKSLKNNRKFFDDDIEKIFKGVFDSDFPKEQIRQVLVNHLLMSGKTELVKILAQEFKINFDERLLQMYTDINSISQDILKRDSRSLISWISQNSSKLDQIKSKLSILLMKLDFTELFLTNQITEFFSFGKTVFFNSTVSEELIPHAKKLVGLLISSDLSCHELLRHDIWWDINLEFCRTANLILQGKQDSPLLPILQVGIRTMEPLLNFTRQYENARKMKYESNVLPVDLKLHPSFQYHSMYICSVLKEPCTVENPPMRLKCGHLISRNGMNSIVALDNIKCPYCPIVSNKVDLIMIQL